MTLTLTKGQVDQYQEHGYIILPGLFTETEIEKLYKIAMNDQAIRTHSYELKDQQGKNTKLALWFTPGDDIYGLLSRTERIVLPAGQLMHGSSPICHFHSKLMQKEPRSGGSWEWHQDYGYWYKNEFLFPDQMVSVMIAVTEANKENGCLQVIGGSHKMGRIEHGFAGEQVAAFQHYVDLALKTMPLVYVELKPGDALFFHSNILHRSEANLSGSARWSMISCYNRQSNKPYNESSLSCITPLQTISDEQFAAANALHISDQADFLDKKMDVTLQ